MSEYKKRPPLTEAKADELCKEFIAKGASHACDQLKDEINIDQMFKVDTDTYVRSIKNTPFTPEFLEQFTLRQLSDAIWEVFQENRDLYGYHSIEFGARLAATQDNSSSGRRSGIFALFGGFYGHNKKAYDLLKIKLNSLITE